VTKPHPKVQAALDPLNHVFPRVSSVNRGETDRTAREVSIGTGGEKKLSAVPQDAIAASQGERLVHEIDRAWPRVGRRRGWLMRRLLLAADAVGLVIAYGVALGLAPPGSAVDRVSPIWELVIFMATLPLWILLARVYGLYDRDEERTDHSTVDDVVGVFQVVTLGTWSYLVLTHVAHLPLPNLERLVIFWLLAIVLVPVLRAGSRAIGRRQAAYVQNVIIVGSGYVARLLATKIEKHPEYGLRVVGFVDRDDRVAAFNDKTPLLGTTDDLSRLVQEHGAQRVAIAFSTDSHDQTLRVIRALQHKDVQIDIVPRMFEVLGTNAQLHTIEGMPLVGLPSPHLSGSARLLKRSFDVPASALGLLLLSPLLLVVSALIKLDSRGPVLFRQVRMGEGDRTFRVCKFRTMVADAETLKADVAHLNMHNVGDSRMFKIPDDPRVTRVGRFLRRWRLDELPQLFNVLAGSMSVVGPRPLILDEDQHVSAWARRRLDLKPGMTGLWQVLGASDIPFEEMTKLDYLYVTNWSLREDLRLILLTLPALARARAAY
jgi:exopolysaccharide biosynthesis polyprenyl glycosylphosphotransferase